MNQTYFRLLALSLFLVGVVAAGWRVAARDQCSTGTCKAPRSLSGAFGFDGKPAIDENPPANYQTATFAMGCFWGTEARFGAIPGVIRTRVGFGGGTTPNPTYGSIGDHAEVVQLDFDPQILTYEQLLAAFWQGVAPTEKPGWRQYSNAILYHDEAQRQAALASRQALEQKLGAKVTTAIVPANFTLAEDYHQKYYLRQTPQVAGEFLKLYPDLGDFINSTAATRINAYLGGYGEDRQFEQDLPRLGLSEAARQSLRRWHEE
ncbi:MAG: peptide-methionine (S)-S-oxide reductase MsrA [Candidatus Eremiobacteraeota bacterium]|nr:peptide-methionine (S)-S-oxide reductase MsrA [Candidatus Eremiobacteraeota bacterium]